MKPGALKAIKWITNSKWGKWRFKLFNKRVRSLCYSSVDKLPIFNWWRISEGDYSYLYKEEQELGKGHKYVLMQLYEELLNQFFKDFGFGEKMTEILEKERQWILLCNEKNFTGNDMLLTDMEILEKELINLKKKDTEEPTNSFELTAQMESILKIPIDTEKCPVSKYYSYLKVIEKKRPVKSNEDVE